MIVESTKDRQFNNKSKSHNILPVEPRVVNTRRWLRHRLERKCSPMKSIKSRSARDLCSPCGLIIRVKNPTRTVYRTKISRRWSRDNDRQFSAHAHALSIIRRRDISSSRKKDFSILYKQVHAKLYTTRSGSLMKAFATLWSERCQVICQKSTCHIDFALFLTLESANFWILMDF